MKYRRVCKIELKLWISKIGDQNYKKKTEDEKIKREQSCHLVKEKEKIKDNIYYCVK